MYTDYVGIQLAAHLMARFNLEINVSVEAILDYNKYLFHIFIYAAPKDSDDFIPVFSFMVARDTPMLAMLCACNEPELLAKLGMIAR